MPEPGVDKRALELGPAAGRQLVHVAGQQVTQLAEFDGTRARARPPERVRTRRPRRRRTQDDRRRGAPWVLARQVGGALAPLVAGDGRVASTEQLRYALRRERLTVSKRREFTPYLRLTPDTWTRGHLDANSVHG